MITQENIEMLTVFAERDFCKKCTISPCTIFTSGEYEKCPHVMSAFQKQEDDYNTFLNSVQKPFVPGKCVFCREEDVNDRDADYKLVTLRYSDGKIRMRGYLCSYHRHQEWIEE